MSAEVFNRAIKHLREKHGIGISEAQILWSTFNGGTKSAAMDRADTELAAERRERAGRPVYRPRNDFTGGPKA